MASKVLVDNFISQKNLAIVGVSRNKSKFGNMAYRELTQKGYKLHIIHPEAETLEGARTYKDFASLPEKVGGALVVVQPGKTEKVVREAAAAGITRIWMQQGSESPEAIRFCEQNGIEAIHGECIMMYAVGTGIHKFHGWVWKLLGKQPR